jgi:hypothetical protein
VAGVNGPPFSIAPPVPPVFTAVLAWACLGVGANLAGEAGAANGASEVVRLGLSEVRPTYYGSTYYGFTTATMTPYAEVVRLGLAEVRFSIELQPPSRKVQPPSYMVAGELLPGGGAALALRPDGAGYL